MISRKATVLISVLAGAAVIAGGMFGVYRYFVTPDRMVGLSLINAGKALEKSMQLYNDDKEREMLRIFKENGYKAEAELSIPDIELLADKTIHFTCNNDTDCSVSNIEAGDLSLEVYKDDERMYVNIPVVGGFEIPVRDFAGEWNESIFKDIFTIPETSTASVCRALADNKDEAAAAAYKKIMEIRSGDGSELEFSRAASEKVTVDGKQKKAAVYECYLSAENYNEIADAAIKASVGEQESDYIRNKLAEKSENRLLDFKLVGTELREIEIKDCIEGGSTYTIAFRGKGNPFNDIIYYKNDDTTNAMRRLRSESSGKLTENITFGENGSFTFEENKSSFSAKLTTDIIETSIKGSGKEATNSGIAVDSIEFNFNNLITVKGSVDISRFYDEDFSFSKAGNYVNILDMTRPEWEFLTSLLDKGMSLQGKK